MRISARTRGRLATVGGVVVSGISILGVFGGGFIGDAADAIADNVIFSILLAFGLLLVGISNLDWIRGMLGLYSPAARGRLYRDWLYKAGYSITDRPDEECHFRFLACDPQGRPLTFSILKEQADILAIGAGFTASESAKQAMEKMEATALEMVADRLRVEMARFGILYTNIAPPFERVTLNINVPADESLDEYRFFEKVNFVRNAFVLYTVLLPQGVNLIQQAFPSETQQETGDKGNGAIDRPSSESTPQPSRTHEAEGETLEREPGEQSPRA
jgi:hypothetical protein